MDGGYANLQPVNLGVQRAGIDLRRLDAIHAPASITNGFECVRVEREVAEALLDLVQAMRDGTRKLDILQQKADDIRALYAKLYILAVHLIGIQGPQHAGPDVDIETA